MEVTITIKLADGSTRVIELQNASIHTTWASGQPVLSLESGKESTVPPVGSLTLQGVIKDTLLAGSV